MNSNSNSISNRKMNIMSQHLTKIIQMFNRIMRKKKKDLRILIKNNLMIEILSGRL